MTTEQQLDEFQRFAREQIARRREWTLEELFDAWSANHPTDSEYAENVAAVQVALADFYSGDLGTPAGEDSLQLRRKHGLPQ